MTSRSINGVKRLRGSAPHVDARAATLSNAMHASDQGACVGGHSVTGWSLADPGKVAAFRDIIPWV
jgi:hypothetical protein